MTYNQALEAKKIFEDTLYLPGGIFRVFICPNNFYDRGMFIRNYNAQKYSDTTCIDKVLNNQFGVCWILDNRGL